VTAVVPGGTAGAWAPVSADRTGPVDPADRGRTVVADRVVAKIAAQAATEVEHAAGLRRSLAGRAVGDPRVRAQADVDGHVTALRLEVAVDFPAPVRQVTRAVRQRVTERVSTLAGMTVDHVDITVAALRRKPVDVRRVL
jgi:uncharacterized alkaline shock family protein YloU